MPTVTVIVRNLVNQLYFSCQLRLRQIFGDLGKASGLAILHRMGDDFLRSGQNALNQSDSAQARWVRWFGLVWFGLVWFAGRISVGAGSHQFIDLGGNAMLFWNWRAWKSGHHHTFRRKSCHF